MDGTGKPFFMSDEKAFREIDTIPYSRLGNHSPMTHAKSDTRNARQTRSSLAENALCPRYRCFALVPDLLLGSSASW